MGEEVPASRCAWRSPGEAEGTVERSTSPSIIRASLQNLCWQTVCRHTAHPEQLGDFCRELKNSRNVKKMTFGNGDCSSIQPTAQMHEPREVFFGGGAFPCTQRMAER